MDKLFLLRPGFQDAAHTSAASSYFCPQCAMIEGFLSYYPQIKDQLHIAYVDYVRPRPSIIELIGTGNQSCPVLVFEKGDLTPGNYSVQTFGGHRFINDPSEITTYLAAKWKGSFPH